MTINPANSGGIRPRSSADPVESGKSEKIPDKNAVSRGDQVEISAEARKLALEADIERVPFTDARLSEIRELLASGHYDAPEHTRALAERLLDSGDL